MMKKITRLLLATLLLLSVTTINIYAAENDDGIIHIKTVDDWNDLAKECSLDSYSKGIKVVLDNSLEFDGDFSQIPYFQGSFDGQGHRIEGVVLEREEKISGLFRITGEKASIKNLIVSFSSDTESESVGFIGYNQGYVENVKAIFEGTAADEIGAITGYNSTTGEIVNCASEGTIYADHYSGGIAGLNYGTIENCKNYAVVNNVANDDQFDINSLTVDAITQSENLATVTDIGGIAGQNYGTISSCTNEAIIGYDHVGYNIGGIAGSSLGCIENCINNGTIYGRKEIGGIVGQAEPAMQLAMQGTYLDVMRNQITKLSETTSAAITHAADFGDENADSFYTISRDLRESYDSLNKMMGEGYTLDDGTIKHTDKYYEYKTTLTSSMTEVFDIMDNLANSQSDTSEALRNDLTSIDNQLRDLSYTAVDFADSITNPGSMYEDVSDKDNDSLKEGKVISCINYGYVKGDINAGGIAGALAQENNLDPEDEFSIVGTTSTSVKYKIKAVINKCTNYGKVNVLRQHAGGIAGSQDLGLIKNSINYGLLYCEDSDYIGGIVGISISSLKNNYAKCFIYGTNYVGGIAGSGTKANGNGSFAQIVEATSNIGSIFGNYGNISDELVENSDDITNNWYVYDLAAIDGISYTDKAYGITNEEMLKKDIDDDLKKVYIYFYVDDELLLKYTMDYGESMPLDKVPTPDDKEADYGLWADFNEDDLNNVEKDLLYIAEYNNIYPSISSNEEPLAYIVAEGNFSKTDSVKLIATSNNPVSTDCLTIKPVFDLSSYSSITNIRLYANGYDDYDVYEFYDNKWQTVDFTVDGSYAVVEYNPDVTEYSIVKKENILLYFEYVGIAGAAISIVVIVIKKIKKNKKEKVSS